jgi:hypothetical protein
MFPHKMSVINSINSGRSLDTKQEWFYVELCHSRWPRQTRLLSNDEHFNIFLAVKFANVNTAFRSIACFNVCLLFLQKSMPKVWLQTGQLSGGTVDN